MTFHTRRARPAKGTTVRGHYKSPRVSIQFQRDIFALIRAEAERRGVPFTEVVREKLALHYRMADMVRERAA